MGPDLIPGKTIRTPSHNEDYHMHSVTYPLIPAKASPLCERIAARAARNEEDKRALLACVCPTSAACAPRLA